jgi:hypothetical protein
LEQKPGYLDWRWRSHSLDDLIYEQLLNGLRKGDADQLPTPLQKPERETKTVRRR